MPETKKPTLENSSRLSNGTTIWYPQQVNLSNEDKEQISDISLSLETIFKQRIFGIFINPDTSEEGKKTNRLWDIRIVFSRPKTK